MEVELNIGWGSHFHIDDEDAFVVFKKLIRASHVGRLGITEEDPIELSIRTIDWKQISKEEETREKKERLENFRRTYQEAVDKGLIKPVESNQYSEAKEGE